MKLLKITAITLICFAIPCFSDPMRVTEDEGRKAVVSKVAPSIPLIAKQAHIIGRVTVDMIVSEDGSVEKVDVVSGNPILGGACVSAGKKWNFKPFTADGKPAKAIVRVNFDFGG